TLSSAAGAVDPCAATDRAEITRCRLPCSGRDLSLATRSCIRPTRHPARPVPLAARRFLLVALGCAALVAVAILFVDRPVAHLIQARFEDARVFVWLFRFVEVAPPLATAVLAGTGLAPLAGWRPGP